MLGRARLADILILIVATTLTACSTTTYRADGALSGTDVSGSYHWHVANSFPLTHKVGDHGENQDQDSANPLAVLTIPVDLISGWGAKVDSTPFEVSFKIRLVDQDEKPVANAPVKEYFLDVHVATTDAAGQVEMRFKADGGHWSNETFIQSMALEFASDWAHGLGATGEGSEISPARIELFLNCNRGVCHVESADHKPLTDPVIRVQRVVHVDQPRKDL